MIKPVKKPKSLEGSPYPYADFDVKHREGCFCSWCEKRHVAYIGGAYYDDGAQIHLNEEQFLKLAAWMQKGVEWILYKRGSRYGKSKKAARR